MFLFAFIILFSNEAYSIVMPKENPMPDKLYVPFELLNIKIPNKLPSANQDVDMPKLTDFEGSSILVAREPNIKTPLGYKPESFKLFQDQQFIWPVNGKISSGYGVRSNRIHEGIDIPMPKGTPIVAARDGVVKRADSVMRGYGMLVIVDHGGGVETRYAHCSAFAIKVGDKVKAGQIIAYVGNSGNSTANHLHFEVLINGLAYNPMRFLDEYQSIFVPQLSKKMN